jgi:transcriptional regulator of arginine metabolism
MTPKIERQKRIRELVRAEPLATQAQLQRRLREAGVRVDQATLSRDVRELGLVKVAHDGGYRYATLQEAAPPPPPQTASAAKRFVRGLDASGNLIVLQTEVGAASAVGEAVDRLGIPAILGTVAGDNTLLIVVRQGRSARRVAADLRRRLA